MAAPQQRRTFRLFKLPEVPMATVFEVMNPMDLHRSSKLSRRVKEMACAAGKKWKFNFLKCTFGDEFSVEIGYKDDLIWRRTFDNEAGVRETADEFSEIFNAPITFLHLRETGAAVTLPIQTIFDWIKLRQSTPERYIFDLEGELTSDEAKCILANCDARKTCLSINVPRQFYPIAFDAHYGADYFHVRRSVPLFIGNIIRSNCSVIAVDNIHNYQLNANILSIITEWQANNLPKLEVFSIGNCLSGIEYFAHRFGFLETDSVRRFKSTNKRVSFKIIDGFDFRREDGILGTLFVPRDDARRLVFVVWPEGTEDPN